jgi:ABC-2 type transport system ATP-binding protein
MDEAERCHRVAILDRGALVADGTPAALMDEIDAAVLEIETDDPRAVRGALDGVDAVLSVAQPRRRLHALVDRAFERPAERLDAALRAAGVVARVRRTAASLEDVFVAATRVRPE